MVLLAEFKERPGAGTSEAMFGFRGEIGDVSSVGNTIPSSNTNLAFYTLIPQTHVQEVKTYRRLPQRMKPTAVLKV